MIKKSNGGSLKGAMRLRGDLMADPSTAAGTLDSCGLFLRAVAQSQRSRTSGSLATIGQGLAPLCCAQCRRAPRVAQHSTHDGHGRVFCVSCLACFILSRALACHIHTTRPIHVCQKK